MEIIDTEYYNQFISWVSKQVNDDEVKQLLVDDDGDLVEVDLEQLMSDLIKFQRKIKQPPYVKLDHLSVKLPKNPTILDVGTEYREYLTSLERKYKGKAYGINVMPGTAGTCQYAAPSVRNDSRFKYFDGVNIPFNTKFDLINIRMVLHHAEDPEGLLKSCKRHLKPNGVIVILDHDYMNETENRKPGTKVLLDLIHDVYDFVLNDRRCEYYSDINLMTVNEVRNLLRRLGLSVITYTPPNRSYMDTFLSRRVYIARNRST